MTTHFIKKYIFAVLFILMLFSYSVVNFRTELPLLKRDISEFSFASPSAIRASVAKLEKTINENVYDKYTFIESYGLVQRFFGTNVENGFAYLKDEDGALTYTAMDVDTKQFIKNVNEIQRITKLAEKYGAKPIVFFGGDSYNQGQTVYEKGLPYADYGDSLDYLKETMSVNNIPVFDYRLYRDEIYKVEKEPMLYDTDHHWRTMTCFDLYSDFVDYMEKHYHYDFNVNAYDLTDKDNYNFVTYKEYFLGSQGRETGINFAGLDDFTLVFPKFETDYSYSYKTTAGGDEVVLNGAYEKTLIQRNNLTETANIYESDRYSAYLDGINYSDRIINNANPDAPRVLAIRDSYFSPIAALLSNSCSELDMVWSIKYDGDYEELIKSGNYDYVIIENGTANLIGNMFLEKD